MKLKVLLIHTYLTYNPEEFIQALSEPLGLLNLATYVKEQFRDEIDISILDLYASGFNKIVRRRDGRLTRGISEECEVIRLVRESKSDIVGIHCNFTGYAQDAMEVSRLVKKALPESIVIMGGAHVSYDTKNILAVNHCIDYIVRGEGEITLYEIIKAIQEGKCLDGIAGIAYKNDLGDIVLTPDRGFIKDIDDVPIPDRRYIDMQTYLQLNKKSFPLAMRYPVATIMASRGCPYNCIFCSTKNMWGRQWRGRSAQNVVREIEELITNYGVREIAFYDDQFLVDKKWVHDICDLIIRRKLGIFLSLPAGTSVWMADEQLLRKMKKAGFYRLNFPVESGNLRSLSFIRKPVKLNSVTEIIKSACKLGFWTSANFIIGFPYETKDEIKQTIKFAYNCGVDYPFFFIARPFPGSEMYDIYKREGLLKGDVGTNSSVFVAKSDTFYATAEELMKMRFNAERSFLKYKLLWLLRPVNFLNYVFPRINSLGNLYYIIKIFGLFLSGKNKRSNE